MSQSLPSLRVVETRTLSSLVSRVRLAPEGGALFPSYTAGQYITLHRENYLLLKKSTTPSAQTQTELDGDGKPKRGIVSRSYTIASAPFETLRDGTIECFIGTEPILMPDGNVQKDTYFFLSEEDSGKLLYEEKFGGNFTLEQRAEGFEHIVMVASGTGLAPFISMIKQAHFSASSGKRDPRKFTLFYANRTVEELGYHEELLAIEASGNIDFIYVPSVTRVQSSENSIGMGRANEILRYILDIPHLGAQKSKTLQLPARFLKNELHKRISHSATILLTCGNSSFMDNVLLIGTSIGVNVEVEGW